MSVMLTSGSPYFYPRPPRGGRLADTTDKSKQRMISIHALRGEGDCRAQRRRHESGISIHALRGEGDSADEVRRHSRDEISIHALRGEGDG